MRTIAAFLLILCSTSQVFANSLVRDIIGTWSDKEGCSNLEDSITDPTAYWRGNFYELTYLVSEGVYGYEWNCSFDRIVEYPNKRFHINSTCNLEGESWKEELFIEKFGFGWTVINKNIDGSLNRVVYPIQCNYPSR